MDDKERIEFLISRLGMTNVEFAARTGIAPATLSHITSGRSKPTLSILRGIIAGFPDLNPEWVLMGTGTMYKENNAKQQIEYTDEAVSADGNADVFAAFDGQALARHGEGSPRVGSLGPSMEDVVRTTVATMTANAPRQRRVVEIRIFFDDGTYQQFN